jgi:stage III sporulation protein AG
MDIKKFFDKYFKGDSKKVVINMAIFILVGVLLILIADIASGLSFKKSKNDKSTVEVNTNAGIIATSDQYEEKVKKDLVDTLSLISGVGRVSVMIYFDGGSEAMPAVNTTDSNRKTEEKDNQGGTRVITEENKNKNVVVINKGSNTEPFIVKQVNPSIGGVMVVAEGAANPELKEKIHNAVKTVLNLPTHKVTVMPMKK